MANRKPLVRIDGETRQLPAGVRIALTDLDGSGASEGQVLRRLNGQWVPGEDQITVAASPPESPYLHQLWVDIS